MTMKLTFKKYQKLKSMQSFRQKFNQMTKEYRNGFWNDYKNNLSSNLREQTHTYVFCVKNE